MKRSKISMVVLILVSLSLLLPISILGLKVVQGRALIFSRIGVARLTVNGVDCANSYIFSCSSIGSPENLELNACQGWPLGNSVLVLSDTPFRLVYWLSRDGVRVTRGGFYDCISLDKWLILSEIALNQTYNIEDDMKGLAAKVDITGGVGVVEYCMKFVWNSKQFNVQIEVPASAFASRPDTR